MSIQGNTSFFWDRFVPEVIRSGDPDEVLKVAIDAYQSIWEDLKGDVQALTTLFDPDTCPANFLPHLAKLIDVSLEACDDEALQRQQIKEAPFWYQISGTDEGINAAMRTLGFSSEIIELFEDSGDGTKSEVRIPGFHMSSDVKIILESLTSVFQSQCFDAGTLTTDVVTRILGQLQDLLPIHINVFQILFRKSLQDVLDLPQDELDQGLLICDMINWICCLWHGRGAHPTGRLARQWDQTRRSWDDGTPWDEPGIAWDDFTIYHWDAERHMGCDGSLVPTIFWDATKPELAGCDAEGPRRWDDPTVFWVKNVAWDDGSFWDAAGSKWDDGVPSTFWDRGTFRPPVFRNGAALLYRNGIHDNRRPTAPQPLHGPFAVRVRRDCCGHDTDQLLINMVNFFSDAIPYAVVHHDGTICNRTGKAGHVHGPGSPNHFFNDKLKLDARNVNCAQQQYWDCDECFWDNPDEKCVWDPILLPIYSWDTSSVLWDQAVSGSDPVEWDFTRTVFEWDQTTELEWDAGLVWDSAGLAWDLIPEWDDGVSFWDGQCYQFYYWDKDGVSWDQSPVIWDDKETCNGACVPP